METTQHMTEMDKQRIANKMMTCVEELVSAALDAGAAPTADIDYAKLADHLDLEGVANCYSAYDIAAELSTEDLVAEITVDAEDIASHIDTDDVASGVDLMSLAGCFDMNELSLAVNDEITPENVAQAMDKTVLARRILNHDDMLDKLVSALAAPVAALLFDRMVRGKVVEDLGLTRLPMEGTNE